VKVPTGQYLSFGGGGWKAALVLDHMDPGFKGSLTSAIAEYRKAYDASVADNPYGVPPTVGMWGGTTGVLDMGVTMYFLHKVAPHLISADYTLRAATYVLGTHPYNNTSWISGVGTSSVEHGYGNTRADNTFVAGGIVPGYVQIMPDLPEAKDQFGMLWFESEYVIDTAAKWIVVGNAINTLVGKKPA
jgi:endoglucanase